MSVQPVPLAGRALERLFTPGARLGWIFRDLRQLAAPFSEPEPDPGETREAGCCAGRGRAGQLRQGAPLADQAQPGPRSRPAAAGWICRGQ